MNQKTDLAEQYNLKASVASYNQQENDKLANNSLNSIYSKNYQSLLGGMNTGLLSARLGGKVEFKQEIKRKPKAVIARKGGKLQNVIPDGAFHSRKHSLPEEIALEVTSKGIPVITKDGGVIEQHAEIEKNEVIIHKELTDKVEELLEKYNSAETQKERDSISIECGKLLCYELLENTVDNTGLIDKIEA